jgi:hypothetical protein
MCNLFDQIQSNVVGDDMFGIIATVVATAGVILSLLIAAYQSHQLAEQAKANNAIGFTNAYYTSIERLHELDFRLVENPRLYKYFYSGRDSPPTGEERAQVLALARIYADTLDFGLRIHKIIPDADRYEGWADFALAIKDSSPAIRHTVLSTPTYWPELMNHWKSKSS